MTPDVSCLRTKFGTPRDLFGSRRTKVSSLRTNVSCLISKIFSIFVKKLSFELNLSVLNADFGSPDRKFSCLRTKFGTQRTNLDCKRGKSSSQLNNAFQRISSGLEILSLHRLGQTRRIYSKLEAGGSAVRSGVFQFSWRPVTEKRFVH